jgi:hypothetical protein
MSKASIEVVIDGVHVSVETKHGDYIRAEEAGYEFPTEEGEKPSHPAMTRVAFEALNRAKRKGLVDIEVPTTWGDFLDSFEFPPADEDDDEPEPESTPGNG